MKGNRAGERAPPASGGVEGEDEGRKPSFFTSLFHKKQNSSLADLLSEETCGRHTGAARCMCCLEFLFIKFRNTQLTHRLCCCMHVVCQVLSLKKKDRTSII
jgi:hypothetical protein